ncbi:MAG TPA: putative sulfate exporter family transporter, partial [Chloroflexota bacterium]
MQQCEADAHGAARAYGDSVGVSFARRSETPASGDVFARAERVILWFVLGFLAMAALNSIGVIPEPALHVLAAVASFLIVMVLGAVGLSVDLRAIRRMGVR